ELARNMVGCVDPDLGECLDDGRIDGMIRLRSRRPRFVASARRAPEEAFRHHAATAVPDADEEDVAHAGLHAFTIAPCIPSATSALRAFSRASWSISAVMSSPYATPVGPTRFADRITSIPPPEPRSSTTSPSCSSATATGFPQPRDASAAASGTSPRCSAVYSPSPNASPSQHVLSQQPPWVAATAA